MNVLSSNSNKEKISYCQKCLKVKTLSPLKHRIYFDDNDKIKINPNPPPDSKNWQQCWTCGDIIAVREIKQEADISTVTEVTDSPFKTTLLQSVKNTGIKSRKFNRTGKTQHQHKRRFKQKLEQYKEEDIKEALKKGAKLISYSER